MKKASLLVATLFAALALAPAAVAQDQSEPVVSARTPPPEHFYKITFVVQELNAEGKPVNSRSYVTSVSTRPGASSEQIRTGSRMPIATSAVQTSTEASTVTQYQYIDIGINFDIHDVHEVGQQLALRVKAEISSVAPTVDSKSPGPVIRNNQWEAPVLLQVGKATPTFTSDAIDGKGAMQVVATATLLQ